jgi:hypothetical protein
VDDLNVFLDELVLDAAESATAESVAEALRAGGLNPEHEQAVAAAVARAIAEAAE